MHRRPADAAGPGLPGARSHVRMALLALAGVALLGALALLAYAYGFNGVPFGFQRSSGVIAGPERVVVAISRRGVT